MEKEVAKLNKGIVKKKMPSSFLSQQLKIFHVFLCELLRGPICLQFFSILFRMILLRVFIFSFYLFILFYFFTVVKDT